jgi:hypothetical protein
MAKKLGRPFTYESDDERPVTVSVRVPKDLHDKLTQYARIHRQSLSELVIDGLKMRLEQEDPRALALGADDDDTVLQDLAAKVAAILAASRSAFTAQPAPSPARGTLEAPSAELSSDSNAVILKQPQARPGRPAGGMRQRILELLAAYAEGLSAEEIRVHLAAEKPIGDTLQGMRRAGLVETQGAGRSLRYVIATQK